MRLDEFLDNFKRDTEAKRRELAETFHQAVSGVADVFPVSLTDLRRKSTLVSGIQSTLDSVSWEK